MDTVNGNTIVLDGNTFDDIRNAVNYLINCGFTEAEAYEYLYRVSASRNA